MRPFTITNKAVCPGICASQAKPEDTEDIMSLLVQTASWLRSTGSNQWSELLEGKDVHGMAEHIKDGDVFIFKHNNCPAGVCMLIQQPSEWDKELWGDTGHEKSIYLHRLAINREYAGKQLGKDILTWAAKGIRFPGKSQIRLDCVASNKTLNNFYHNMGYEYKGESSKGYSKFEKML